MTAERTTGTYPRALRPKEWDVLAAVLPAERPGYQACLDRVSQMIVLGEGRRGPGNLVLGIEGDRADITSPLPAVIAYGVLETTRDVYSITVREEVAGQIDIEIVSSHGEEIPDHFEEKRRWTYSTWLPGETLPSTGEAVRTIAIDPDRVLGIAAREKRLLLHDGVSGMNHLIPITNFHNELMLHKGIRDPKVALNPGLFFEHLADYSDEDLSRAFIAYNRVKRRVSITETGAPEKTGSVLSLLRTLFGNKNQ